MNLPSREERRAAEVRALATRWSNGVLECRAFVHSWMNGGKRALPEDQAVQVTMICPRCSSRKVISYSTVTGLPLRESRKPGRGYAQQGSGPLTAVDKAQLRLELFRRQGKIVAA